VVGKVDDRLLSDAFWSRAFRPDDPLLSQYIAEFRRGVVEAREDDLAWARLAIYSLQDDALLPVISRLTAIALNMPGWEFVESLAFFLSDQQTLARLRPLLRSNDLLGIERDISALKTELTKRGDADLSQRLDAISALLSAERRYAK